MNNSYKTVTKLDNLTNLVNKNQNQLKIRKKGKLFN